MCAHFWMSIFRSRLARTLRSARTRYPDGLSAKLSDGSSTTLRAQLICRLSGRDGTPNAILLKHHGLHVEIQIDRSHMIGRNDPAGVCDVTLESAITTIEDCEDSVAAVDAADKVRVYRNWLGLMKGTLIADFDKGGKKLTPKRSTRTALPDAWPAARECCPAAA
jgi:malate synthase